MSNEELKNKIAELRKAKSNLKERKQLEKELFDLEHPFISKVTGFPISIGKKWLKDVDRRTR